MKKEFKFKIGADPEFNISMMNQRFHAEKTLTALLGKKYTRRSEGFKVKSAGEIGWDGCASTGEIRPKENKNPEETVNNISELFKTLSGTNGLLNLSTLSEQAPVGGHIHFELLEDPSHSKLKEYHRKLCSFYLPLYLGEDGVNLRVRSKSTYGRIGDFNISDHGEHGTYEFRVPSAEWITTPQIATATLAYLGTVWNEITNNPKSFAKAGNIIIKNQEQAEALQKLTITNFVFLTSVIQSKIKQVIKKFEYYPAFKEEIDFILSPKKVLATKRKVNFDIIKGWGIATENKTNKKEFLSQKKKLTRSKNADIEILSNTISVQYNDDKNVGIFVETLKKQIIKTGCPLKNNFFFFGLKNGIKDFVVMNKDFKFFTGQHMIKTYKDVDILNHIFQKMNSRFNQHSMKNDECILIGIPYKYRLRNNPAKFLELIYDLEHHNAKFTLIVNSNLFDDKQLDPKKTDDLAKIGEFYKTCKKIKNNSPKK